MAVSGAQIKTNPKKRPRVAQEKKGNFVTQTKTGRSTSSRKNAGETLVYLLIFGLVSILFLNFMGIMKIPFLQFLRPGEKSPNQAQDIPQNVALSQTEEQKALYQGPKLEVVDKQESVSSVEAPKVEQNDEAPKVENGIEVTVVTETPPQEASSEKNSSLALVEASSGGVATALENVHRVAKIYSAMEPQEAVRILEKFSDEEVVVILSSMKERQVAEILKVFPVDRAVEIARKLMKGR